MFTPALFILEAIALVSSIITLIKVYDLYKLGKIDKDLIYQAIFSGIIATLASIVVALITMIAPLSPIVITASEIIYEIITFIGIIAATIAIYYLIRVINREEA